MPKKQPSSVDITQFNLLADNVLLQGIEIEARDGIIKPASYDEKPELATVVKVGSGRILDNGTVLPLSVRPGDTVLYNKYSQIKFNFDGKDYYVIKEEDITGYLR